jgi:hypothetical protein
MIPVFRRWKICSSGPALICRAVGVGVALYALRSIFEALLDFIKLRNRRQGLAWCRQQSGLDRNGSLWLNAGFECVKLAPSLQYGSLINIEK